MKKKAEYSLSGFIISLLIITLVSILAVRYIAEYQENTGTNINSTIINYNQTKQIINFSESMRTATEITPESSGFDIIGAFFSGGYSALKTSAGSFKIMNSIVDEGAKDIPEFGFIRDIVYAIFLIILFVGIFLAVLLKWNM